ncbi:hypothetical protein B5S28_g5019 [[Candida] boidinii]|nr:hypothetical protein B5S28_g5019 [[Candida] boidinii]OWB62672.1 hypothetical protein B5S29_g3612 [[Candida] boidinii]
MSNKKVDEVGAALVKAIRLSSALNSKDVNFYKQIDSDVKTSTETAQLKLSQLLDKILVSASSIIPDANPDDFSVSDTDSENQSWKIVSDVLDSIFENSEISIEDYVKYSKNNTNSHKNNESNNDDNNDDLTYLEESERSGTASQVRKPHSINISKPQTAFTDPLDRFDTTPFKPLITTKPNSIIPFNESTKLIEESENIPKHYENPYSYEIMNQEYPAWILDKDIETYKSIPWKESDEPKWIDHPDQLDELLTDLAKSKVIAVDLEHHDYRTYHGLTSLMQITTDSKHDYLIDTLSPELRPHLSQLNIVFTDPNIVKVFHGAFMDIIWLQRDLGIYVVSLFDTFHAAKELALGRYSLAFLLEKYVRFRTSKKWQLADWRIRPLSNEMRNYAKADTHFLIEVFYLLQNDILNNNNNNDDSNESGSEKMSRVLYNSRKVSNRRFEFSSYKPSNSKNEVVSTNQSIPQTEEFSDLSFKNINKLYIANGINAIPWSNIEINNGIPMSKRPLLVALFKWRDDKARKEDESPRFIMSDYLLISLVHFFDINVEITESSVLQVINSNSKFGGSSYIRSFIRELTVLIKDVFDKINKEDIENWNNNTNNNNNIDSIYKEEDTNKTGNSYDDVNDIYNSVRDTKQLEIDFNELSNKFKKEVLGLNNNNDDEEKDDNSDDNMSTIGGNSKYDSAIFGVEYTDNGGIKYTDSNLLKKRLQYAIEVFTNEDTDLTLNGSEIIKEENTETTESATETETPVTVSPELSIAERAKEEDRDEIITLRRPNSRNNSQRKNKNKNKNEGIDTEFDSNADKLDLTSKKVLTEPVSEQDKKKKKNNTKKRSFDPYAAIDQSNSNVPMLKRKKAQDYSKNMTFTKKRK